MVPHNWSLANDKMRNKEIFESGKMRSYCFFYVKFVHGKIDITLLRKYIFTFFL